MFFAVQDMVFQGRTEYVLFQKETGDKSVAMATTQQVSFCFFCDAHF